jgi:serine phosphatase RsbU (regulator of sigma subunit)/CHASE3 domain sensor protein
VLKAKHRPFLGTLALLFFAVAFLVAAGLSVRGVVSHSFRSMERIGAIRALIATVLKEQLDEETGVRGYAAARHPVLLEPYDESRRVLPVTLRAAQRSIEDLRLPTAAAAVSDALQVNRRWLTQEAAPILAHHPTDAALMLRGKRLIDRFRIDVRTADTALAQRQAEIYGRARTAIGWIGFLTVASVGTLLFIAMLFSIQQYRLMESLDRVRGLSEAEKRRSAGLRAAYRAERRIADTLQGAFVQRALPQIAGLHLSATYAPAEEERLVGGDWYDAVELANGRVLLIVGDVAGHGITAAVAMNRARQALILSSVVDPDPAALLERANEELVRDESPLITAVVAVIDPLTHSVQYAVAGHPAPLLLEPGHAARLLQGGSPPLGLVVKESFETYGFRAEPGSVLVLYTDGVIEHSRDLYEGEALLCDVAEATCKEDLQDPAHAIADAIFATRARRDDVAILVVRFGGVRTPYDCIGAASTAGRATAKVQNAQL